MNELELVVNENKLPITQAEFLFNNFKSIFETAKELELKAREIVVTDISQTELMDDARKLRIQVKNLRCDANNKRIELKEESLRTGKAIQGMFNVIEVLTKNIEGHLEKQEKFKEIEEMKVKQERLEKRQKQLTAFVEDVTQYNLLEMSEAGFEELLQSSKIAHENKIAEQERLEKEAKQKELDLEIHNYRKDLLIPFWNFLGEDTKSIQDYSKVDANMFKNTLEMAKERKNEYDKEQKEKETLLKKQQAEIEEQRKKNEAMLAEQAEKDRIQKEKVEREAEEKRQAQLAPDKEKLTNLIATLNNLEYPKVESEKANQIIASVKDLIGKVSIYILKNSKEL